MARFCPLFSGSTGNATYIATPEGGILIDTGVSARRLEQALLAREVDPRSLRAIFLTHEHSDHIAGLRVFLEKYEMPVYGSPGTVENVPGPLPLLPQPMPDTVEVAGMRVKMFHTLHDSAESTGYRIEMPNDRCIGVATDLGCVTPEVHNALAGCDLVLLESNHDVQMLRNNARYPAYLKQRILSDTGHLSNPACAAELEALVRTGTTRLFLGHLSRENNLPQLVYTQAKRVLQQAGMCERRDFLLTVAAPECRDALTVF